ncbi:MAG TPA: DUF4112 domain-containing protein [Thermoanaerobaculia bacterium]
MKRTRESYQSVRPGVLEPEVLPPDAPDPWIEKLAWLMDQSIPVGRWRIGLDGIIGLVPGLGDLIGAAISAVIVAAGVRAGLPRSAIARMVANVAIEAVVGVVPFLGDLFDMAWKANTRNVEIFREALKGKRSRARDSAFVAGLVLALAAILSIPIVAIVLLLQL